MNLLTDFIAYLLKNAIILIIVGLGFFIVPLATTGFFDSMGILRKIRFAIKNNAATMKGIVTLLWLFIAISLFIFLLPRALPFALAIGEITLAILAGIGLGQIMNFER